MPKSPADRPKNYAVENENQAPSRPPHAATDPAGSKGSSRSDKTATDPSSGESRPEN